MTGVVVIVGFAACAVGFVASILLVARMDNRR